MPPRRMVAAHPRWDTPKAERITKGWEAQAPYTLVLSKPSIVEEAITEGRCSPLYSDTQSMVVTQDRMVMAQDKMDMMQGKVMDMVLGKGTVMAPVLGKDMGKVPGKDMVMVQGKDIALVEGKVMIMVEGRVMVMVADMVLTPLSQSHMRFLAEGDGMSMETDTTTIAPEAQIGIDSRLFSIRPESVRSVV